MRFDRVIQCASVADRPEFSQLAKQAGLLTSIPFVLLVGPALGYFLGKALDARWSHAPWGVGLGLVLGFVASARLTTQLIQQARDLTQKPTRHD